MGVEPNHTYDGKTAWPSINHSFLSGVNSYLKLDYVANSLRNFTVNPEKNSVLQGSKRQRIPDPEHRLEFYIPWEVASCLLVVALVTSGGGGGRILPALEDGGGTSSISLRRDSLP